MRAALVLVLLAACGADDPSPAAVVVSATPEVLDPSRDDADDLTIVVDYADADADLGGGVAAIHDCRASGVVTELEIPPIASDEAIEEGVPIEGTLALVVSDVGEVELDLYPPDVCEDLGLGQPRADEVVFCVVLRDAAGHDGPGDCTMPIMIASGS